MMRRFKNILYVNESTVDQRTALARAVSLAENNGAALTVVDVIPVVSAGIGLPPGGPISADLQSWLASQHREMLEQLVAPFRARKEISFTVLIGKTFLEVIRAVLRNACDLVIKPAEDLLPLAGLFGSNDMHLLRKCPCPVWLLGKNERPRYDSVLAAVDFDPFSPLSSQLELNLEILELASSLATTDSSSLHIVHAWEAFAESTLLSRAGSTEHNVGSYVETEHRRHADGLVQLTGELGRLVGEETYRKLSPRHHLPKGPAEKAIARMAQELRADVVVMGTIARSGIAGFIIGNTAETILNQLTCSVLAVKPPGFVTPVHPDE